MYSPKINEELIPKIYELAKQKGVKMTKFVNDILEKAVKGSEEKELYQPFLFIKICK